MNANDRRLIAEVLAGRTAAFGELVRRYHDRLYNVALRVVDSPEDAADVVQDTLLSAYQSLGNFKGDAELFTWLYRIAFNTAVSMKRKRRTAVSLDAIRREGDSAMDPEDLGQNVRPGAALERTEDERSLTSAMSRLSDEHRMVLVLKDMDGLKYEEIAAIMGVPVGTIRSRLHRARLELRNLLVAAGVGGEMDPANDAGFAGVKGDESGPAKGYATSPLPGPARISETDSSVDYPAPAELSAARLNATTPTEPGPPNLKQPPLTQQPTAKPTRSGDV